MRSIRLARHLVAILIFATPGVVVASPGPLPVAHDELSRALDELAGQLHGLGSRWREHFGHGEPAAERPLISLMLRHRVELGLSQDQVDALERLRADFTREATRRDADLRTAEGDLAAFLRTEPVDLGQVEAKIRQIERVRGDQRIGRLRTIEQGKARLTPEQRAKLQTLLGEPRPRTGVSRPDARERL